jgi:hypothetical protein
MDVMADQIIDRTTAEGLQADARRDRLLVGWVVVRDQPGPGQFIARLVTDALRTRDELSAPNFLFVLSYDATD